MHDCVSRAQRAASAASAALIVPSEAGVENGINLSTMGGGGLWVTRCYETAPEGATNLSTIDPSVKVQLTPPFSLRLYRPDWNTLAARLPLHTPLSYSTTVPAYRSAGHLAAGVWPDLRM